MFGYTFLKIVRMSGVVGVIGTAQNVNPKSHRCRLPLQLHRACALRRYNLSKAAARLCANFVHGSTKLTTNGSEDTKINYLTVRPEHGRRAPIEFSHSLPHPSTKLRTNGWFVEGLRARPEPDALRRSSGRTEFGIFKEHPKNPTFKVPPTSPPRRT